MSDASNSGGSRSCRVSRRGFLVHSAASVAGAVAASTSVSLLSETAQAFFNAGAFWKKPSSAGTAQKLSLRLNGSSYIRRTPSSAGNKRTWTFSAWVKRGSLGTQQTLMMCGGSGNYDVIHFTTGNAFEYHILSGGSVRGQRTTTRLFRDVGAWYHLVVSKDATNAIAKIYVNGIEETSFSNSTAVQNLDGFFNGTGQHYLGENTIGTNALNGYMAEVQFVDGAAIDASNFGQTDALTGAWSPKAYSGDFGLNGFYLPFNDLTNAFKDTAPISVGHTAANNWSGVNLGTDSLHLHFDGTNGSTTFTESSAAKTITPQGAATISTTQSKFGGASGSFVAASSSWLSVPTSTDFNFGTGDFTIEAWVYLTSSVAGTSSIVGNHDGGGDQWIFMIEANLVKMYGSSNTRYAGATALSTNSWYHVAVTRSGNTIRIFVNGTVDGTYTSTGSFSTSGQPIGVGGQSYRTGYYFPGYMDELRITKGVARYTSNFSVPSSPYISNQPGWSDLTLDHPTNNHCTLSSIYCSSGTISNANLTWAGSGAGNWVLGTMGVKTGGSIYVFEAKLVASSNGSAFVGWSDNNGPMKMATADWRSYKHGSLWLESGSCDGLNASYAYDSEQKAATGLTYTVGDVIGVQLHPDGSVKYYKNGVLKFTSTSLGGISALTSDREWFPTCGQAYAGASETWEFHFSSNSMSYISSYDANAKTLCAANLPTPAIKMASQNFNVVTYTGNSANRAITNTAYDSSHAAVGSAFGFQPDFVWIKTRSAGTNHALYDSARGANKRISSDLINAEVGATTDLTSFDTNGFSLGTDAGNYVNTSGYTYVAWCWKKGATPGFDVQSVTAASNVATFNHTLGVTPAFAMFKNRTQSSAWAVYHQSVGVNAFMRLYTNEAAIASAGWITLSSTQVVMGNVVQANGDNIVGYLFSEVPGFSKFGMYYGNGSTEGPFVYCGFRPKFVLIKDMSAASHWYIHDGARNTSNVMNATLLPNTTGAETTNQNTLDFLSNGFKLRNSAVEQNISGRSLIFAAFAEAPFKYATAR